MESNNSSSDDIFHAVTMGEESTWQKGYEEGVEEGKKKGFDEGFNLGIQKGTELGREVGFYAGYAAYILKVLTQDDAKSRRMIKLCETILMLENDFASVSPTDELLSDLLSKLQSKFKQLTSLLAVKVEYKVTQSGSDAVSF